MRFMLDKEKVKEICNEYKLNYSNQFLEFAMKYNSEDLVREFCKYWRQRPIGGGDFNKFFLERYTKKLGEK